MDQTVSFCGAHRTEQCSLLWLDGSFTLHIFVCATKKLFRAIGGIYANGVAHTAFDWYRKISMSGQLEQLLLDSAHDNLSILITGLDQQCRELIAAIPRYEICCAGRPHQGFGHGTEHIITY